MRLSTRALGALAFVFCLVSTAWADIVYLTDGTWIRGTILRETKEELEIDGKNNAGITLKVTIQMSRVSSIIRVDPPAEEPAKDDTKPATPDPAKTPEKAEPKEKVGDFLVIPLKGTFGEEIVPMGVKPSLEWAVKNKVKHIVFTIDSGGGEVWAAEAIREMMEKHSDDLTYHMIIKQAMSASIWVVFSSHHIAALPKSTLGAAVAFKVVDSGEAEVDEKMNSALAARLAAGAESRGHSPHLVRAMILTKYDLFAAKEADGTWKLVHDRPAKATELETLSDGTRVVTLTATEMEKYGVAAPIASKDDKEIAAWLGNPALVTCGTRGETNMKKAESETKAVAKQIETWATQVLQARDDMAEAIKADDVDAAIRSIDDFLRLARRVGALRNRAEALGMVAYPAFKRIDVEKEVRTGEDALSRLRALKRERNGGR